MKKYLSTALIAIAAASLASPAMGDPVTYTTDRIAAVTVSKDNIEMSPLTGVAGADCSKPDKAGKGQACFLVFQANPTWFAGKQLCVTGRVDEWAVKRNGAIITDDPMRRAECASIAANGSATVSGNFRNDTDVFIAEGGRIVAWASKDDVIRR